jgi:hypothetical protein
VARQYLQDGGPLEPAITDPKAASAVTTAEGAWNSLQYTMIPAFDSRPGKVYVVEAGGLITTAATGALTHDAMGPDVRPELACFFLVPDR